MNRQDRLSVVKVIFALVNTIMFVVALWFLIGALIDWLSVPWSVRIPAAVLTLCWWVNRILFPKRGCDHE